MQKEISMARVIFFLKSRLISVHTNFIKASSTRTVGIITLWFIGLHLISVKSQKFMALTWSLLLQAYGNIHWLTQRQ